MAHDVFISYSTKDKLTADAVCGVLESHNVRCWIAPRDIQAGSNWGEAIINGIDEARILILIFSAHANASQQVMREVQHAFEKSVIVIPFRVENILPIKSLDYYLGAVHWLDAMSPPLEKHLERLAVRTRAILFPDKGDGPKQVVLQPVAPQGAGKPAGQGDVDREDKDRHCGRLF